MSNVNWLGQAKPGCGALAAVAPIMAWPKGPWASQPCLPSSPRCFTTRPALVCTRSACAWHQGGKSDTTVEDMYSCLGDVYAPMDAGWRLTLLHHIPQG